MTAKRKLYVWKDKMFHWRYAVVIASNGWVEENPRPSYYSKSYAIKRATKMFGPMPVVIGKPKRLL